jgi:hypothetical protein
MVFGGKATLNGGKSLSSELSSDNATQCPINQQIFPLIPERLLSEPPKPPLPLAREIAT